MNLRNFWAFFIASVLLIGTASADIVTDYDRKANFSSYKTYSWGRLESGSSMWDQRIKDAIDSQLALKGWKQVDSGGDVVVYAVAITRLGQDVHIAADGWGGGPWGFGPAFGDAWASKSTYAIGTLIIRMFDASTKRVIWFGLADDALSTNSDKSIKTLDKDVTKMFKKFPTGSYGK